VVDPVNPVILLVKLPLLVPSNVLVLNATVAPVLVLQQIPLAVTGDPPSALMLPPDVAVVLVMAETAEVVSVGSVACAEVVKIISEP